MENLNKEFVFIINKNSAGSKHYHKIKKIIEILENFNVKLIVIEPVNLEQTKLLIKKHYLEGKRNFLVSGGDGSLFHVINSIMENYIEGDKPTIGIIPSGTGNAIYSSLTRYEANFETRIIESINTLLQGTAKNFDVFKAEFNNNQPVYFTNILCLGVFVDSVFYRNKYLNKLGELGYDLSFLYGVFMRKHEKINCTLKIDDKIVPYENYVILIQNSKYIGNKAQTSPFSLTDDGFGELVLIKNTGVISLLKYMLNLKLTKTKNILNDNISYSQFKEIEFSSDKEEENILIDGEIFSESLKKISIIPSAIKVIY